MKKRSILMLIMCALLSLGLCIGALSQDVSAVSNIESNKAEPEDDSDDSEDEDYSDEDDEDTDDEDEDYEDEDYEDEDYEDEDYEDEDEDEDDEDLEDEDDEDEDDEDDSSSSSTARKITSTTSRTTSRTSTTSTNATSRTATTRTATTRTATSASSSGSSKTDARGNTLLLTESQRRARFRSRTNPKRGAKPVTVPRPNNGLYAYADFGTYNNYNSENGLGGTPIYLIGTIMQIEKVSYNALQFQAVLLVNDCDGYQWYMRSDVNKAEFDAYKALYLGKSGYIFGNFAGYSGVTNRPMMDVTLIVPSAVNPAAATAATATAATAATAPALPASTTAATPTTAPAPTTVPANPAAVTPTPAPVPASVVITPLPLPVGYKYVVNTSTLKIHYPTCSDVKSMTPDNTGYTNNTIAELALAGYTTCGHCNPR